MKIKQKHIIAFDQVQILIVLVIIIICEYSVHDIRSVFFFFCSRNRLFKRPIQFAFFFFVSFFLLLLLLIFCCIYDNGPLMHWMYSTHLAVTSHICSSRPTLLACLRIYRSDNKQNSRVERNDYGCKIAQFQYIIFNSMRTRSIHTVASHLQFIANGIIWCAIYFHNRVFMIQSLFNVAMLAFVL